jgi:excinuclease ABC subunit C
MNPEVLEQVNNLPHLPGVYLFHNKPNTVIYVGKAVDLYNRVKSYFTSPDSRGAKIAQLVDQVDHIEFILAASELHALVLECNLIKKYRPKFNVRLRDDKMYPYIKIDIDKEWPRIAIARRILNDNAKYFGPYISAGDVRATVDHLKKIFKYKLCKKEIHGRSKRPCLYYDLGNCPAPCCGLITPAEYKETTNQIIKFLEGKQENILSELKDKMNSLSEQLDYEKAAVVRDQIKSIQNVIEGQKTGLLVRGDKDVIAISRHMDKAMAEVFQFRNNKLVSRTNHVMEGTESEDDSEIMTDFLKLYYSGTQNIPSELILQTPIIDQEVIIAWLRDLKHGAVKIVVPVKGTNKEMVDVVSRNAETSLQLHELNGYSAADYPALAVEVKQMLKLPSAPARIEGYDISNIQGNLAVGSMVVFDGGRPRKDQYRKFRIKIVEGIDDYSMIQEVLKRRFNNYLAGTDQWTNLPDLILIDGGKGHLHAAMQILKELNLNNIPLMSLAKENEEIFLPSQPEPLRLPGSSRVLHLFERVRDEAHRFAIGYHRNLRSKNAIKSELDDISGIGPRRRRELLKAFGSVNGLKKAGEKEIAAVKGMNVKLAARLRQYLESN